MTQEVKEKTWSRIYQGALRSSILDHVYTNDNQLIEQIKIEKQPISDHQIILIRTYGRRRVERTKKITYDCWKGYSKEALETELRTHDLDELMTMEVQEMADKLDQIIGTARDKLIERKTIKKKSIDLNTPSHIILLKRKLKNMYKKAKRKSNVEMMKKSRELEKYIRREMNASKTNKIRAEANLGPNNLWKAVKIANNTSASELPQVSVDGKSWKISDEEKAECFADSFEGKIKNITENLTPNVNEQPSTNKKILGLYEENWVTLEEVKKVVEKLKPKRCQGFDRIPQIFYIDGAEILTPVITRLMQKIMEKSELPEQWKIAKVIPTYKKGKRTDVANYRPISNLCSITKIFERLILDRINAIEEMEHCDLTGASQHGFKKHHSTESAGVEIQTKIAQRCDKDEFVTVTSIDLTAAFDVINHDLIIKRLVDTGLPKIITNVIKEWLEGRSFYCEINNATSELKDITHGTVQGSILGPVLFAIFIANIENVTKEIVTFADDNYVINHDKQRAGVIEKTRNSLQSTTEWLSGSGMKVNDGKTEICMFYKKDVQTEIIEINGREIMISNSIKVLGVVFDSKLNWEMQARNAMNRSNKAKQGISLIRRYFTEEETIKLATAYFYSTLYYGAKIWLTSGLSAVTKKRLWQISAGMLRIVEGKRHSRLSYVELHKKYKRATPTMWGKYTTALAMWELVNYQMPEATLIHAVLNRQYQERRSGMLFTRSNRRKIGFNCLSNRLQAVSKALKVDWHDMSKETFKAYCKKTLIIEELNKI